MQDNRVSGEPHLLIHVLTIRIEKHFCTFSDGDELPVSRGIQAELETAWLAGPGRESCPEEGQLKVQGPIPPPTWLWEGRGNLEEGAAEGDADHEPLREAGAGG